MANAGCINAIGFDGTYLRTLDTLDSANIGVGVQYCIPAPLDDKRLDYIKYTDKCGCTCCITGENEILVYATNGVIKNFTLTNDDTNEVVKVKWNDLFGSNRAYTMVRYKTGSYPTSITDGTLAVKETTQNQYSVSGYNVSGLTDGTTYYFTAFAVSQDGTIIVVQNNSITTDFGRNPGANTFLYYSFDNQTLNDDSGNNRNGSRCSGAGSFTTGIKGYGVNNGNRGLKIPSFVNSDFTISIRVKPQNTSLSVQTLFGSYEWTTGAMHVHSKADTEKIQLAFYNSTNTPASEGITYNERNHIVITRAGNVFKIYKNKNLILTHTYSVSLNPNLIRLVGNGYTQDRHITGVFDEIIIETKARTQEEITKYYDKIIG